VVKKDLEAPQLFTKPATQAQTKQNSLLELAIALCTVIFVLCILVMLAPLKSLAAFSATSYMPVGDLLVKAGSWLPSDLHLATNPVLSKQGTGNIEFLLLMGLAFVVYGVCALLILRQAPEGKNRRTLQLIWVGVVIGGLFFLFGPDLLSHDIFVYAGYGRLIDVYHANPYFVPLSTYFHDPIYALDDYASSTSAYGPFWLVVCAISGLVSGAHPLKYIIFFRLVGLAAHVVNIMLVTSILRMMGRSSRTVTLGTQLYAWNPLVLLESSHGGHNDIFMITFILLGILFSVRAEKGRFAKRGWYLLPIAAFTLATLVKYTVAPLIILFLIALACIRVRPAAATSLSLRENVVLRWKPALLAVLLTVLTSSIIILMFYGPFFAGHSIHAIASSFTSPPSSQAAHKSLLDGIIQWSILHPLAPHSFTYALVYQLSRHSVWNLISILTLAVTIISGAFWMWHRPTIRTFILASLTTLGALLLVVPWFFPWYVTWLVALAVVCLPVMHERIARGLLAFTLTFSASAFFLYLYNGIPPANVWNPFSCLLTFGPPVLAFFFFAVIGRWLNRPTNKVIQSVNPAFKMPK
jgi:hypothetical protein